jgi:branched-chain amino acid aminotransferase
MVVFLNGRFVPEDQAVVSIFDRGFLYGDGLFETMRVSRGRPFRWTGHFDRFDRGAALLGINIPYGGTELREQASQLIERNGLPESLLRLAVSRGIGPRGYAPKGADNPTVTMTLHPMPGAAGEAPPQWRVATSSFRLLAGEKLAQFKTCNKLPQVLARAEAEARGADEALLLNTEGQVVEGATSNLFWVRDGVVETPPLASGILAGVTRVVVLELCQKLGLTAKEKNITPEELRRADGVFLTMSSWGVVEAVSLDGEPLKRSHLVGKLQAAYAELVEHQGD